MRHTSLAAADLARVPFISSLAPLLMAAPSSSGKKQRTNFTGSAFHDEFEHYANELNAVNEKRERLVKASRDVTFFSKKVIFQVHRINSKNKVEVLEQAEKDLAAVKADHIQRVAKELQGIEYWKFRRAYTPGMQEYVEAATLLEYCKTGKLLTLEGINQSFLDVKDALDRPFRMILSDYLLGLGDLTGELMRLAISRIADGEANMAIGICNFVRYLFENLTLLSHSMDDNFEMIKKMETMLQSLMKIENACYTVHVRGSEFPGTTFENMDMQFTTAWNDGS